MNIALGILNLSRTKGGAERYLLDLSARMAARGCDVHVYANDWSREDPKIRFHRMRAVAFPKSLRLFTFARQAAREMASGHHDVTLAVGNTLEADVLQPHGGVHWAWFWRSLRAYRHPVLWTVKFLGRILSPKQWVQAWIEHTSYRAKNLHRVIAISEMVKQDVIRWQRIPEDRIVTVYNGVDLERFHPRNRQFRKEIRDRHDLGEVLVLLFVSNNFRLKGLECLIRVLSRLKKEGNPAFKLVVLGRDRSRPYRGLAERLGLSAEVVFAGSTDAPERYYGAADLLVHPTFYDACSLTVLEAMASGIPVITTASNGASGLVDQGEDGWVIQDPRNADGLAEAIRYFFDDKVRDRASRQARNKVAAYSEAANVERVMGVLQEAAARKQRAAEGGRGRRFADG